jgi:hypothetical protein
MAEGYHILLNRKAENLRKWIESGGRSPYPFDVEQESLKPNTAEAAEILEGKPHPFKKQLKLAYMRDRVHMLASPRHFFTATHPDATLLSNVAAIIADEESSN